MAYIILAVIGENNTSQKIGRGTTRTYADY
jgi:hypothetical protein